MVHEIWIYPAALRDTFSCTLEWRGGLVKAIQSSFSGELTAFQATGSWTFHWQPCWILNIDTDVCAGQQSIKPADYHWRKGERWKWIEVWLSVFLIRVRALWGPAQRVYWLGFCVYGWRNKLNSVSLTCDYRINSWKLFWTKMYSMLNSVWIDFLYLRQ